MNEAGAGRAMEAEAKPSLTFSRVRVGGAQVQHATGGLGRPLVFLHGWGIGPRCYAGPLARLADAGFEVFAPALPGFAGTSGQDLDDCSFSSYSAWLARYLEAVGARSPVVVVGHSFGGGVAVQFAHDHPEQVSGVIACNGVGGTGWSALSEKPWWEWGRNLGTDLFAFESLVRVLPVVIGQSVPNMLHDPLLMWRVGEMVRRADLRREMRVLKRRGIPVTVVWSDRDRLVPHSAFSAMCRAAGVRGIVVQGQHNWLIADPDRFVDVVVRALVEGGGLERSLVALSA